MTFAMLHGDHAAATAALVEKYARRIQASPADDARGHLVQFATEAFGGFCDRTAAGFVAWVEEGGIQCPSCDEGTAEMHRIDDEGGFACAACGYKETR